MGLFDLDFDYSDPTDYFIYEEIINEKKKKKYDWDDDDDDDDDDDW